MNQLTDLIEHFDPLLLVLVRDRLCLLVTGQDGR